ncbi:hypothetical protein [Saccharibacillus deserti]|uniref:hypothetical protein n=1 Tax=Saccharibacillus deserti TaxID=1634444 RepID=UPI001554044A|nr:hypothetical protein [Saccharibacillus deserti]
MLAAGPLGGRLRSRQKPDLSRPNVILLAIVEAYKNHAGIISQEGGDDSINPNLLYQVLKKIQWEKDPTAISLGIDQKKFAEALREADRAGCASNLSFLQTSGGEAIPFAD